MSFEKALKIVLAWEGGYVNDPKDPGGETNFGISKRAYPDLDIKRLTHDQVAKIYKRDYWDRCLCGSMFPAVAIIVFDTAVNMGRAFAITTLQHVVGVSPDGIVGNQTIQAVNMLDPVKIVQEYSAFRMLRYTNIKNFDRYGKGWTRRLFDVALKAVRV